MTEKDARTRILKKAKGEEQEKSSSVLTLVKMLSGKSVVHKV